MCGLFGAIVKGPGISREVKTLARHARRRGSDSSGAILSDGSRYRVVRADFGIDQLLRRVSVSDEVFVAGHSRLITNGLTDNQPIVAGRVAVLHNGIIVNTDHVWASIGQTPKMEIDTEIIAVLANKLLSEGVKPDEIPGAILSICIGVINCVIVIAHLGKILLFSNNGSLYLGEKKADLFFSSEEHPLRTIECTNVKQITAPIVLDIPAISIPADVQNFRRDRQSLVPAVPTHSEEEKLLKIPSWNLRRCSRCILPETMPFLHFDRDGVCNYCHAYTPRNSPKPKEELLELLSRYRRQDGRDAIIPFSGGRDSSFGLHLAVEELGLKPIAYTYDWGMVTDLGRRNISKMCSALGVENIVIAANIEKKRRNIRRNLEAWLKSPHLGMLSLLTAGDKHFFRYINTVKRETNIDLNLWAVNPLEVTHFKSGFLGVPPDFEEKKVYSSGVSNQVRYHRLRFGAMLQSKGYFNASLWDTLSGEYYRSASKKKDYFHLFDYIRWDEKQIEGTLRNYDWEIATDTSTTWRIGDGTAAFYNYVYARLAGFTEHDTFRSNQVREGDLTRSEALRLAEEENLPRYQHIKWYLDAIGLEFSDVIATINGARRVPVTGGVPQQVTLSSQISPSAQ